MAKLKVNKIRYWETRRGIGFQAGTKYGDICNDGMGGATFFLPTQEEGRKFQRYSEWRLNKAVEEYEQNNN